ncbi:MAG: hypothetical protein RL291_1759 [Pseudomonadota bacterium]
MCQHCALTCVERTRADGLGSTVLAFAVFLSAHTLSIFYRSALAVVVPEVSADTGATLGDLGRASAAWFFVFALAQLPVGWALDRFGPRRTLGYLLIIAALGAFWFSAASAPWQLIASMGLVGLGCSAALMGAIFTFGRTLEPKTFAQRTSWLLGLSTLGGLLAATPLSSAVVVFGWRATFATVGALTFISAVLVLSIVRDPPRAVAAGGGGEVGFVQGLRSVVGLRALWPIFPIVMVSYAVVAAERGLWSGPYFSDVHGLGAIERGTAVLAMAIAMAVGAFFYGEFDRITGRRKLLVIFGSTVTALAFIALGAFQTIGVVPAAMLLAVVGGAGFTYGLLLAHGRSFLPEHLLGRGLTLLNLGFISGAGIMQLVSGAAVSAWQAEKLPAVEVFGRLHLAFGVALLITTAIYLLARERPKA